MQNNDDQNVTVYAGFFVRLCAFLLDSILVAIVRLFIQIPIWVVSFINPENIFIKPILFMFSACDILFYLLTVLYFVLMTYNAGATIGKRLLNLKVISAGEDEKLTLINVIYRETIGRYLSTIIMNIGYFLIGADKEKRGLHDILCDTRVVYTCKMRMVYPIMNTYGNYGQPYGEPPVYGNQTNNNTNYASPNATNDKEETNHDVTNHDLTETNKTNDSFESSEEPK